MSDANIKRWVDGWERAGQALDELRRRELVAMSDDDTRRAIADIFSNAPPDDAPARAACGLVEQQRLFASLRQRA